MPRPMLTCLGVVTLALLGLPSRAEDAPPLDTPSRVAAALADADPLAEGSTSPLLTWHDATERALARVGTDTTQPGIVQDRALRLLVAWNRVARVSEERHVATRSLRWWLSLDELDREIPTGPRETLLAQAVPEAEARAAALQRLASAREVAVRFCRDWNEIDLDEEQGRAHAALRTELVEAGKPAIPYLATLLAVPPQAVFSDLHGTHGPTARQQVRALFALGFLDARQCLGLVVFHVRGPSLTQGTTAQAVLAQLAGISYPQDADENAQVAAIDAWWRGRDGELPRAEGSWVLDHLRRHTLRWARTAHANSDPDVAYGARYGPLQLAHVIAGVEFDADAPHEEQAAQLARLERNAMARCPVCIR